MSGFDFEEFVARLLNKLGYGQVKEVLFTQDEGRDVLIQSPDGLIVVECKHQPKTGVGRPIVQKLHSAVISSQAVKGMLVTTGHFTEEAIEYAKKLSESGTSIDMIDRRLLADMASRAGIRLSGRGEELAVWTYPIPNETQTRRMVGSAVASWVTSEPREPLALLRECKRTLAYRPMYVIRYSVDSVFETSVGVIHRESASDVKVVFDGNTGELTRDDVVKFFEPETQTRFTGTHQDFRGNLPTFQIDSTSLLRLAKQTIIRAHTKTVRYSGRNNVSYTKVCEPGERDVYIHDVRQVYLPTARLEFSLEETGYHLGGVQAPSGRFLPLSHDVLTCRTCGQSVTRRGLLCDTCGRVTHSGGFLLGSVHGFKCGRCRRTTCRAHGHWRRRYLIWRELLCPECNEIRIGEGKPTRPLLVKSVWRQREGQTPAERAGVGIQGEDKWLRLIKASLTTGNQTAA